MFGRKKKIKETKENKALYSIEILLEVIEAVLDGISDID